MVDITSKSSTLRIATAEAIVRVSRSETIVAIKENTVPKGNVFEMAKAAGFLGVKKTPHLLPDCHPIPIESTTVNYTVDGLEIKIEMCVKTIYKTGVEVEAMHGASVVALTLYDMLKPIDKGIEISTIRLLDKKGGKSDIKERIKRVGSSLRAAVIVCSDTIAIGQKEDKAGQAIISKLKLHDLEIFAYDIIPDEVQAVQSKVKTFVDQNIDLIIFTGGTGLSVRDTTPEAILPLLERRIPGIEETIRNYGQARTPFAMLSRSVAGTINKSLVLALPGSTNGAKESIEAIFPELIHVFNIMGGHTAH